MNETLEEKDSLEEQDEQQDEENQEETEDKSETVPLSKYMKERKDRQDAERKLSEYEAAQERKESENKYVQEGVDPKVAEHFAAQDERWAKIEDVNRDNQIDKLAADDFFSDAPTYRDDIKARMKKYDISVEEAYMMVRGPLRAKELADQQAQLALYSKEEAEEKGLEPGPAGTKKTKPFPNMSESDKRAFNELRKMDSSWTQEKYYELMCKEE